MAKLRNIPAAQQVDSAYSTPYALAGAGTQPVKTGYAGIPYADPNSIINAYSAPSASPSGSGYTFGMSNTNTGVPSVNNSSLLPNSLKMATPSLYKMMDSFQPTQSLFGAGEGLSSLSPQQLAIGSGMPITPTIGGASNFSNGGFNLDLFNNAPSIEGNPLGLKLGAEAGGGLPKIAMTDKINAGVGAFNAAVGALSAYKMYQLGKANLNFQKDSFNKNFEASKNTTNAQLENAQRVRVSADPTNAMSVADYMAKYGVK